MEHHFNVDVATTYGIVPAIFLNYFEFWDAKNRANEQNYHDGLYWTHNSVKGFQRLFPYLSQKQIHANLQKLIDNGFILTGNYNENQYDRTLWYALTEKGKCILPTGKMDLPKRENGFTLQGKCIDTVKEQLIEPVKEENIKDSADDSIDDPCFEGIQQAYNMFCPSLPQCRELSDKRKKAIKACWKKYGPEKMQEAFKMAEASDFLSGRSGKWTGATFDWLLNTNNMLKVLEGNYVNKIVAQSGNSRTTRAVTDQPYTGDGYEISSL